KAPCGVFEEKEDRRYGGRVRSRLRPYLPESACENPLRLSLYSSMDLREFLEPPHPLSTVRGTRTGPETTIQTRAQIFNRETGWLVVFSLAQAGLVRIITNYGDCHFEADETTI